MKITVLSDLHGTLLPVEDYFEPCELVSLCGDIVPSNVDASNIGLTTDGPIQRLFDFVYNCSPYNIGDQALKGQHDFNYNNKITIKGVEVVDNASNRKNKFYQELSYYVVVNQNVETAADEICAILACEHGLDDVADDVRSKAENCRARVSKSVVEE